ncbi:hypothetical protein OAB62_05535 [Pseudomonadales bacterium]|nr:hypothetical protein [Pseudomonadales bacterium]
MQIAKRTIPKTKKLKKLSFFLMLVFVVVSIFIVQRSAIISFIQDNVIIRTQIKSLGIGGIDRNVNFSSLPKDAFRNLFSGISNNNHESISPKPIILDIKFKQFKKLENSRARALQDGMIFHGHPSVRAKLQYGDDVYDVKVGLKGYFLDHIATKKWSLKVDFDDKSFDGMSSISIQAPFTRDFQTAPAIAYAMQQKSIITPRSGYLDVTLNGRQLGVMYYEERLGEALTENSGVPYGPIFKYDEKAQKLVSIDKKAFWSDNSLLRLIGERVEPLLDQPNKYVHLINEKKWAEYFATTFLFKCFHGSLDLNLIYYLHPLTQKIEPISNDHSCGQKDITRELGFLPKPEEIAYRILQSGNIVSLLKDELDWWQNSIEAKKLVRSINKKSESVKGLLSRDAPFLKDFKINTKNFEDIHNWLDRVSNEGPEPVLKETDMLRFFGIAHKEPLLVVERSKTGFRGYIREFEKKSYQLRRFEYKDQNQLVILEINNDNSGEEISKLLNEIVENGVVLKAPKINIFYDQIGRKGPSIKRRAVLTYENQSSYVTKYSSIDTIKKYFKYDGLSNLFYLDAHSSIQIDETLRLPPKHSLRLDKGSKVTFADRTGLIINGSFFTLGDQNARVMLTGSSNLWSGVHINGGGAESLVKYLTVNGGTGLFEGLQIRGSFTINDALVTIEDSRFMNNLSEDALNLNQVIGVLKNVEISNTRSDGLDADFSNVTLIDSRFVNIGSQTGADAIDISRTSLDAEGVEIMKVTDKAISIGEESKAYLENLDITDSVVGVVAKDSSDVQVKNIELSNVKLAHYMAYNKKPHYSGATIEVLNHLKNDPRAIAEHGSAIKINGKIAPTQNLDVEQLYSNIMKSIK